MDSKAIIFAVFASFFMICSIAAVGVFGISFKFVPLLLSAALLTPILLLLSNDAHDLNEKQKFLLILFSVLVALAVVFFISEKIIVSFFIIAILFCFMIVIFIPLMMLRERLFKKSNAQV